MPYCRIRCTFTEMRADCLYLAGKRCVYFGVPSLWRAFTTLMHYAVNECAMPIRLHCNELRALCLTANALCRTVEFGALLLKCVLIVYIWPEKGVVNTVDCNLPVVCTLRKRAVSEFHIKEDIEALRLLVARASFCMNFLFECIR